MVSRVEDSWFLLANETLEIPDNRPPRLTTRVRGSHDTNDETLFQLSQESYKHLRKKSESYLIERDYFNDKQNGLERHVREEVVSWLVDSGPALALDNHTIAMAVNCFDRFLGAKRVSEDEIGKVAAASLLIATKVYIGFPPPLSYLASLTGSKVEDIVLMEALILKELEWQVNGVPSNEFIPFMINRMRLLGAEVCEKLVEMLLDVSLLQYDVAQKDTCTVAGACVLLASELQDASPGPERRAKAFAEKLDLNYESLNEVKDVLHESFKEFFR